MSIVAAACAGLLLAADVWKTKDYTQWTSEEISKILTDSPWAKEINVTPQGIGEERRQGNRRSQGGGIGYPGGGIGYPGGGYPGGYPRGGGYPGAGNPGGYPGGGGYPSGGYPGGGGNPGGGYPDDDSRSGGLHSMRVTVRWSSGLPVQQALARERAVPADESKRTADAAQKDYIIAVLGLRMPSRRGRASAVDSSGSNEDRDRDDRNEALRSRLIDAAQLIPKGKSPIYAEDVQFEGPDGANEIRFLFPKTKEIAAEDKEVIFRLDASGIKFEHKFRLSDMNYQGKLAL